MTIDEAFNEAGVRFTAMDLALATATAINGGKPGPLQTQITAAHDLVETAGAALAQLRVVILAELKQPEPSKPIEPKLPTTTYQLTADEIKYHIQWGPAFGEFGARLGGDVFRSHAERALYVQALNAQGQAGSGSEPAPVFVDTSGWTAENWAWFAVQGYAVQSRVDQTKNIDKVQGYGPGGRHFDPNRQQMKPGNI